MDLDSDDLFCDEALDDYFNAIPPDNQLNIIEDEDHHHHQEAQHQEDEQQTLFDIVQEANFFGIMIPKEMELNYWNPWDVSHNLKLARMKAITWIFICRGEELLPFRFHLRTVYLSIAYFDRFVYEMIRANKDEQVSTGLITVACVSLAAKMEERDKAPPLTFYNVTGLQSNQIARMEGYISVKLQWKMNLITPFDFLNYFILRLSENHGNTFVQQLLNATEGFILLLIKEINYMRYRPSVVAASATLMALDQTLTWQAVEARLNSISFYQTESVFECYSTMRRLQNQEYSIGTKRKRPDF